MIGRSQAALLLFAAAAASPVVARPVATTRLVSCGADDCLLVRGRRASPRAAVRINGHPVAASGEGAWQVTLPLATVRDWSTPFARTLQIAIEEPTGARVEDEAVRLPVGLLAHRIELASLTVRAR
ncbi:hypothetical protein [Sphingomonas sp.]|uniref:hypothetical protein n=1 Tax=Sphingomonas sp. TaxID=28214 RepID=UPI003B007B87